MRLNSCASSSELLLKGKAFRFIYKQLKPIFIKAKLYDALMKSF